MPTAVDEREVAECHSRSQSCSSSGDSTLSWRWAWTLICDPVAPCWVAVPQSTKLRQQRKAKGIRGHWSPCRNVGDKLMTAEIKPWVNKATGDACCVHTHIWWHTSAVNAECDQSILQHSGWANGVKTGLCLKSLDFIWKKTRLSGNNGSGEEKTLFCVAARAPFHSSERKLWAPLEKVHFNQRRIIHRHPRLRRRLCALRIL